jgi:hypothetical protein
VTAEPELWFDDDVEPVDAEPLEVEPLEVEPLDEDESSLLEDDVPALEESSLEVTLAVVAVSDWPEVVWVESVVAVLPSEPLAAIVPKAIAKVARAVATTRRRMTAMRRARARRRSRTRSAFGVGGGVEGMQAS